MEIFYRNDPTIYNEEIELFASSLPDEYAIGGDTYLPAENKWRSGVHRISKTQYDNRTQLDSEIPEDDSDGDGVKLWFAQVNGLYFVCQGTKNAVKTAFERHFKTRFKNTEYLH